MFVIDTSQEVTPEMIQKMKRFIEEQLSSYNVSAAGTRISLIAYGNKDEILMPLRDGVKHVAVNMALDKMKKIGGERKLDVALRTARNDVLSYRGGARNNVGKLVVVFITGPSDPERSVELGREGKALKDADVKVSVIGIGSNVMDTELEAVASDSSTISKVESVNDLNEAAPVLSESAGKAAGTVVF